MDGEENGREDGDLPDPHRESQPASVPALPARSRSCGNAPQIPYYLTHALCWQWVGIQDRDGEKRVKMEDLGRQQSSPEAIFGGYLPP